MPATTSRRPLLPLAILWAVLSPASPAVANVLSGTPEAQIESNLDGAHLGRELLAADVDGDGRDDLLVAADHDEGTDGSGPPLPDEVEGAVFLFLSPIASRDLHSATLMFVGDMPGLLFGRSLAAGDFNADGFLDLAFGAPGRDGSPFLTIGRRVYVFFGSATGYGAAAGGPVSHPTLGIPFLTAAAADAVLQSDRPEVGAPFGTTLLVGDFNGDGIDDLAVGSPGYTNTLSAGLDSEGAVVIFHGSPQFGDGNPQTAGTLLAGGKRIAFFGTTLAVGDFNGDGIDDLIVGAPRFDVPRSGQSDLREGGGVFFFAGQSPGGIPDGTAGSATVTLLGDQFRGQLGTAIVALGDVNGDGSDDFAIGADVYDNPEQNEGVVFFFLTAPPAVGLPPIPPSGGPAAAAAIFQGDASNHLVGRRLAVADVDGDGFLDLLIGAPSTGGTAPRVYLVLGSASGFVNGSPATADAGLAFAVWGPPRPFTGLASALVTGHFDFDAFADVAAGAPNDELGTLAIGDEGAVELYAGGNAAATPPIAHANGQDGPYQTAPDTPLSVEAGVQDALLSNDFANRFDPVNPAAPIPLGAVLDVTTEGTLSFTSGSGAFSYTPDPGFTGFDFFTYHVNDGISDSLPAVVAIRVGSGAAPPTNRAPAAFPDAYATPENTPLVVGPPGVLGNDNDPDGDPLAAAVATGPANGSLNLAATGAVTYTPNGGFRGVDTFTYRASDGIQVSAPAAVTITVGAANQPPTVVDDGYSLDEDTTLSVAAAAGLLANDADADHDPLAAQLATPPAHGSLTLGADGSFGYAPDADFFGTDSFTYLASDGIASSPPATVELTVVQVHDCPEPQPGFIFSLPIDGVLEVAPPGLLDRVRNPDLRPLVPVILVPPANGTLILLPGGGFRYQPNPSFRGRDEFVFVVDDGSGEEGCATEEVLTAAVGAGPRRVAAGALSGPATVTLVVGQSVVEVPSLEGWGIGLLALALVGVALWRLRSAG